MTSYLSFIAGIIITIGLLAADIAIDGCAEWIGKGVQICKQETPNDRSD